MAYPSLEEQLARLQQQLDPTPLPGPMPPPMQVQQQQSMPPRGSQNAPFELGIASMPGPPQMQNALTRPQQMQPYQRQMGPDPMSAAAPQVQMQEPQYLPDENYNSHPARSASGWHGKQIYIKPSWHRGQAGPPESMFIPSSGIGSVYRAEDREGDLPGSEYLSPARDVRDWQRLRGGNSGYDHRKVPYGLSPQGSSDPFAPIREPEPVREYQLPDPFAPIQEPASLYDTEPPAVGKDGYPVSPPLIDPFAAAQQQQLLLKLLAMRAGAEPQNRQAHSQAALSGLGF